MTSPPKCLFCGHDMENANLETIKEANEKINQQLKDIKPAVIQIASPIAPQESFVRIQYFGQHNDIAAERVYSLFECTNCPFTILWRIE